MTYLWYVCHCDVASELRGARVTNKKAQVKLINLHFMSDGFPENEVKEDVDVKDFVFVAKIVLSIF